MVISRCARFRRPSPCPPPVVELRRLGRRVPGDLLRVLQCPPFGRYAVIPVARNVWQQVEGGSPATAARRLIIGQHHPPRQRPPPRPVHALEQRLPPVLEPARPGTSCSPISRRGSRREAVAAREQGPVEVLELADGVGDGEEPPGLGRHPGRPHQPTNKPPRDSVNALARSTSASTPNRRPMRTPAPIGRVHVRFDGRAGDRGAGTEPDGDAHRLEAHDGAEAPACGIRPRVDDERRQGDVGSPVCDDRRLRRTVTRIPSASAPASTPAHRRLLTSLRRIPAMKRSPAITALRRPRSRATSSDSTPRPMAGGDDGGGGPRPRTAGRAGRRVDGAPPEVRPAGVRGRVRRVEAAATRTREAMSRGANVIYQGRLDDDSGRWSGYPDFLLRLNRPSPLGR